MAKKKPKATAKPKPATKVVTPEVVFDDVPEAHDGPEIIQEPLDADAAALDNMPEAIAPPAQELLASSSSAKGLTTSDPVTRYMAEIRKYSLITREEEERLAKIYYETRDPLVAEKLVTANLRFVVKVAAEYSKFGAKLIDLIQEGNVGLMHAVKEFNPYKGVRLITYAVWWIRGYIQEFLMRQYSMVRIGTTQNQRKLFYQLQREREQLERMGPDALKELSGRLGIPEDEIRDMQLRLTGRDLSLNQPLNDQDSGTFMDFQTDIHEEPLDDRLGRMEQIAQLKDNIEKIRGGLSEKELYLLDQRVLSDEPMTLQEIGEIWGVTREAVRQMEARLIGKIKAEM